MQSAIVFTTLLALATAAVLPKYSKSNSQNELIQDNIEYNGNSHNYNYEDVQPREERNSIGNSFDSVVNVMRQYKNDMDNANEFGGLENVISIPDTVNIGNSSDTYLTNVHVTGLKNFRSQSFAMSWEEDVVMAQNSWEKLTVNGVYHYISAIGRHSGSFAIVLVDPVYAGNTSLTKNANVYATMSPVSSVVFRKAVIDHTMLPTVFQNEKPQFDSFVKNVVCQYVATSVANSMYNDLIMSVKYSVRPYLTYQTGKIINNNNHDNDNSNDNVDAAVVSGKLTNGNRFELKNMRFDSSKNNWAKIYSVQMNNTDRTNTAVLRLRLLNMVGECDCVATVDGKNYNEKLTFAFQTVQIKPTVNFDDKTVNTQVWVSAPRVEPKQSNGSADFAAAAVWMNAEEQSITPVLVEHFKQRLAETTSQSIKNIM